MGNATTMTQSSYRRRESVFPAADAIWTMYAELNGKINGFATALNVVQQAASADYQLPWLASLHSGILTKVLLLDGDWMKITQAKSCALVTIK